MARICKLNEEAAGGDHNEKLEWVDLDLNNSEDLSWIEQDSSLGEETTALLVNNEQRNRRFVVPEGLFLSLCYPTQTIHEPSEEPIFRMGVLLTQGRIVTVHRGQVSSLEEMWKTIQEQPDLSSSSWGVLAQMVMYIAADIEWILEETADLIDELEDQVFHESPQTPIEEIGKLRRQLILDRRHITALNRVMEETVADNRMVREAQQADKLHSAAQLILRQVRTVEFFLERANLIQDQIQSLLSDRINTATLRLGVVATVFLPLGFLTGLLGINVAGMPGSHNPLAFWVVCAILTVLAMAAWVLVGRLHREDLTPPKQHQKRSGRRPRTQIKDSKKDLKLPEVVH